MRIFKKNGEREKKTTPWIWDEISWITTNTKATAQATMEAITTAKPETTIQLNGFFIQPEDLLQWALLPPNTISLRDKSAFELAQIFGKYINPEWIGNIVKLWYSNRIRKSYTVVQQWTTATEVLNQEWLKNFAVYEDWGNNNINPHTNGTLVQQKDGSRTKRPSRKFR